MKQYNSLTRSWWWLFTVATFYQVTIITEVMHTQPLLLGEIHISFLQASGHIFVNQSIHNVVSCMFLFKDTLFNIYLLQIINCMVFEWCKAGRFRGHVQRFVFQCSYKTSQSHWQNQLFHISLFLYTIYQVFLKFLYSLLICSTCFICKLIFFLLNHLFDMWASQH